MLEAARQYLRNRSNAYATVFDQGRTDARIVLEDLAKFCRAHESTFHADHSISDRLDGRREVFLRIGHYLHLTDDELWNLYGNKSLPRE